MIEVTTDSGFTVSINEDITDDWDFMEALGTMGEDPASAIRAAKIIFGNSYQKAKDFCRKESGTVSASSMMALLLEVLQAGKTTKNS